MSVPSWNPGVWEGIRNAMHEQVERTAAGRKFLPHFPVPESATSVPRDKFEKGEVARGVTVPIAEIFTTFSMSNEQIEREETYGEGRNAAVNRARELAQAEDLLIFQGKSAYDEEDKKRPAAWPEDVKVRDWSTVSEKIGSGLAGTGMVLVVEGRTPPADVLSKWGVRTVEKVVEATNGLNESGYYGPYALVLKPRQHADARTPIAINSLIVPYDPIRSEVDQIESTRTLPQFDGKDDDGKKIKGDVGIVISLGGESVDLVMSDPRYRIEFMQTSPEGMHVFRVSHRFAVRIKRDKLVTRLVFTDPKP